MTETRREMATRHVLAARRIVDAQKRLVAELKDHGRNARDAERLLLAYEASLRIFEDDLDHIIREENA